MTIIDPHDPAYCDEKTVRDELTRVFDVCHGCRRCVDLCSSFPTLFEMIDSTVEGAAGRLAPADQDDVVDRCFQCQRCAVQCPYAPGRHELGIDVPRLMIRAVAMRGATGQLPARLRITANVFGRSDRLGRLGTSGMPLVSGAAAAKPGSAVRRFVSLVAGVSAVRALTPFARGRFSRWFGRRTSRLVGAPRSRAIVFPTCLVEYQSVEVGMALVGVYERRGIECTASGSGCCGAPWQRAGDLRRFGRVVDANVTTFAAEIRSGGDLVVPQPTCAHLIRSAYAEHASPSLRADAEYVARHTFDAVEYLERHRGSDGSDPPPASPAGDPPGSITYHVAGHLDALGIGRPATAVFERAGLEVRSVALASGTESLWDLRTANDPSADHCARRLADAVDSVGGDTVIGDCVLSNAQVTSRTGVPVEHPLQLLARLDGIAVDDDPER